MKMISPIIRPRKLNARALFLSFGEPCNVQPAAALNHGIVLRHRSIQRTLEGSPPILLDVHGQRSGGPRTGARLQHSAEGCHDGPYRKMKLRRLEDDKVAKSTVDKDVSVAKSFFNW